jgi:hypothetical protein
MYTYFCNKLSPSNNLQIYRMIQEEMSIFLDCNISFCEEKKVNINMCLILNSYRDRALSISRLNSVRFLFTYLDEERSYKRNVDIRDELLASISDAADRIKKN